VGTSYKGNWQETKRPGDENTEHHEKKSVTGPEFFMSKGKETAETSTKRGEERRKRGGARRGVTRRRFGSTESKNRAPGQTKK